MNSPSQKERAARLRALFAERIVVIDGAMGTMIQRHKLEESHYRGDRFEDHSKDVKGNNDLLVLTQPRVIEEIHEEYLAAGCDLIETPLAASQSGQPIVDQGNAHRFTLARRG